MARPHVGLPALVGDLARYAEKFDLVEIRPVDGGTPKPATLRSWRKKVSPGFVFSVVLPKVVGELKPTPELDQALATSLEVATAVQARCLVLATPPSVTPTELARKRLTALVERIPHDAVTLAWEPAGLWDLDEARLLAQKLGIVLVMDPVRDPAPAGPVAYFRLRGLGESTRLGPAAIERVVAAVRARREAFVVVEAAGGARVAAEIRRGAGRRETSSRGGGTVVRPRATLHAEDEEQ